MTSFFPFLTLLQPGILWPVLAPFSPSLIAAALGLFVGLRKKSVFRRGEAFTSKTFVYLAIFLTAQFLSLYYSGVSAMIEEFMFWLPFALFVIISVMLMSDAASLRKYVWGMMVGSMFIVLYGIYAVPAWGGYEGTGRAGAYGMYDNHNDYSFVIIQVVPFLYLFWRNETGKLRRWFLVGSLAACSLGMAMSMSRGGMITLVVEAALIVVIGMEGRRRLWILPVLAVIGTAAVAFQYAQREQNQGGGYTAEDAESSRYELWRAGRNMFLDKPLLGVGSRRFYEFAPSYAELSHDQRGKNSHNTFIEIGVGSGLIGFLGFVLSGRNLFKELKRVPTIRPSPFVDAARKATIISMYAIILRAILDAKSYDWCFYVLAAVGIACFMLIRTEERAAADALAEETKPVRNRTRGVGNLRHHVR